MHKALHQNSIIYISQNHHLHQARMLRVKNIQIRAMHKTNRANLNSVYKLTELVSAQCSGQGLELELDSGLGLELGFS